MTDAPVQSEDLPDELYDALMRVLYGGPGDRAAQVGMLRAGNPEHAAAIDWHWERFREVSAADGHVGDFGPYRVLEKLGEGTFGRVLLAEEPEPVRRRVAIKVLKGLVGAEQLESEYRAIASLNHDHIAKCFDRGEWGGESYLVLEFVEDAESLVRYCEREGLSIRRRLDLFKTACHALHHAHEREVHHLDVKPGNILVAKQEGGETLKVVDFGQARCVRSESRGGSALGTPPYSAPEQLMGSAADRRADVHALGMCLHHLLSGRKPLELGDPEKWTIPDIIKVYETGRRSPSSIADKGRSWANAVRGDIDAIVAKATDMRPDLRYATALELASDVDNYLDHRPVLARGGGRIYRLGKAMRRYRGILAIGMLAAMAMIAVMMAMLVGSARPPVFTPWRMAAIDGAIDKAPTQVAPGDVLGVSVLAHTAARVAAVSITHREGGAPLVHVAKPWLLPADRGSGFAIELSAGTHDLALCQVDKVASNSGKVLKEELWVFHLDDSGLGRLVNDWIGRVNTATTGSERLELDHALRMLRNQITDRGRGEPITSLTEQDRSRIAMALQKRGPRDWPLDALQPTKFLLAVVTQ